MRKISTIILAISSSISMAQITIPNNSFENWSPLLGSEDLGSWTTINESMIYMGSGLSATKTTDKYSGTYAMNLKNVLVQQPGAADTIFGGYASVDVDITDKKLPAYLTGHIKYNVATGDKAIITYGYLVEDAFLESTLYIIGYKSFTGTSSSYIPFTINTNAFLFPKRLSNKLQISITTYDTWSKNIVAVSEKSNITIDSLGFGGTLVDPTIVAGNAIANGSFETWTTTNGITRPNGWFSDNSLQELNTVQIEKSVDASSGSFAMQFSIDKVGLPLSAYTFFKASATSKFVNGYAKYNLNEGDSALVYVTKYTSEEGLGGAFIDSMYFTGNQASYLPFSLNIGKATVGDTLIFQVVTFNNSQNAGLRTEASAFSAFYLDDVSLSTTPLGLENETLSFHTSISPNPSTTGVFTITSNEAITNVSVYNSTGKAIETNTILSGNTASINIGQNPRGVYFLVQESENKKVTSKIVY